MTAPLQAIASPRRREILRLIWSQESAVGEVHRAMPEVTIGAVSQQLQAMLQLGLVEMRSKGQLRLYRAKPEAFGSLRAVLESMWDDSLLRLKVAAELEQARRGPRAAPKSKRKGRNQI